MNTLRLVSKIERMVPRHRVSFPDGLISRFAVNRRTTIASKLRPFSTTWSAQTDGVFRKLTEMRVPVPWIDALRDRQRKIKELGNAGDGVKITSSETSSEEHNIAPKRMSDSYVSVILPLGQDKWLSDTYLNSEGNIRCASLFFGFLEWSVPSLSRLSRL
jgi:acyl-coenzyme A thioesterase 9